MKYIHFLFFLLITGIFFNACQKAFTEESSIAIGSLVKVGTDCAPIDIEGSFRKTTLLTIGNFADIQVNFATAGSYDIKSDTVNGYWFRGVGQTAVVGINTIRLQAAGTPLAVGVNVLTITFGTTTCQINVNVTEQSAVFTLGGTPGNCTLATIAGNYSAGTALNTTNTVAFQVNVAAVGAYTISTNTLNGISFSKSSAFSLTGLQTVILLSNSGVPLNAGTFNFTVGTGGCTFALVVSASTSGLPIITTTVVSSITASAAVSGGIITNGGTSLVTARGVCWSNTAIPTIAASLTSNGSGLGNFTSNISPLASGTTYYVRAYATNSAGTAYGNEVSFVANTPGPDVYVAGYQGSSMGLGGAVIWKNGLANSLTTGINLGEAYAVFVSGTDVYAAGTENNGTAYVAKYWKNGVVTSLTDGSHDAAGNSIYVSGTDVYVAGYEVNSLSNTVAKFWKNGVPVSLTDGTKNAEANSIFVSGADVYVAGYQKNATFYKEAMIWKNGVALSLTDGTRDAIANCVFILGIDVYVAGTDGNVNSVAKVWKNGIATSLTSNAGAGSGTAQSVFVSGTDVYVAGTELNFAFSSRVATFWKNGVVTYLTNGINYAEAFSVKVVGADIYVAGYENAGIGMGLQAKVWKNGVATSLGNGNTTTNAYSIFVQ